jgi:hypothetical protein
VGRGEFAGECLTGEPAGPADESGRLKLWAYGKGAGCDEPNGFERPNELPFCSSCGMWELFEGLLFVGLEGTCGRWKGGGDDGG